MAKDYRKQLTFQAGEVSPKFLGRSDAPYYNRGLAVAENVFIEKRGGVFRRHGYEHIARGTGNDARVFTKQIHLTRFDTIFLTDQLLTLIAPGAGFLSPNLLSNPTFIQGGTDWTETEDPASSIVSFSEGACQLIPETHNPELVTNPSFAALGIGWSERVNGANSAVTFENDSCTLAPRQQVLAPGTNWAGIFQALTTTNVGVAHEMLLEGTVNTILNVKVGTGEDDGTYLDIDITDITQPIGFIPLAANFTITLNSYNPNVNAILDSVSVEDPITKIASISQEATVTALPADDHFVRVNQADNASLTIKIGTTVNDNDIAEVVGGTEVIDLEFIPNAATFWVTVEADGNKSIENTIVFVGAVALADAGTGATTMVAPWTEEQIHDVHLIEDPTGETMYFVHPNVPPQQLVYSFSTDVYTALTAVVFTNAPAPWTGTNWPATGTFFQGRLWLGGTPNEPQTFWGSVSALPTDFTVTGGLDSSSLEFTLQKFGRIKWMLGTKTLAIGAENGEHIVSAEGPVITPTDFEIEQQSSYGSHALQAVQVGEKIFYITPDGRRLQSMAYEWQEDNWLSQDLTFVSEQITEGIAEHMIWAQNPNALLGITMEDGTVAMLTYDRTADTVGWTHYLFEGYTVFDIGTGLINGNSRVVFAGQRVPGFVDVKANGSNDQYLDSYVSAFYESGGNVITGLEHLEGDVVQVIVDGSVEPPKVVIGGQITTERSGILLYAGIQIKSKIKTLPPDVDPGSIRSWKKRWNKVWALMYKSKVPIINGVRPPDRTPSTLMDTSEPVTTTHHKTVNLGWDDFGQITIEENLPVAMNILAIYGEMGRETL